MNIKNLKELIENFPDNMEVILQKDSEGNGYSPLSGIDMNVVYIPKTSWTTEDVCMSKEEWKLIKSNPRVLLLLPVN